MRSGVACMIFGTSRAALGVGMPVEGLVDMARSRVLVRLDTLQPAHIDGDDGVCDSITAGPSCPRGTDGSSVLPRGLIPDSLRSRGLDDRGLFKAVVSAVSPDGLKSDVGPLPRRLPPRPSAEFLRKSWSAGEGDLEWELLESGPLDRGGVDDGVLGEVAHNAVRQGAFEVAFKRPVVLTSMTVRMAQPEGYVLVRGILPGEDEKLRWWCVLTGAGDHNVIEVARTLSSIPSRWGTASVPVDGLDIGSVRFHTNRPVKIISMEAVVEGPSVGGGESSVLVLHQGGEKGKGLVGYEGLVGPRAPYVDMATVMREGMTWRKEQDLQDVQDPPALLFSMGKLRRTLAILASPESSCCFCGNTRKDALRTAKVLVSRMEQVVGTHWGRHAAANIDCIVEYAVASAKGHNLAFLDVFSTQECGCDGRQECTVTSSGIQQSLEALSRRLDWVERAFRKSGEAAEEGPPPDGGSGEMKDIIAAEVYEPYSHHRLHRASRSGISATELLDFLEDMMADGGTAPPSDVAGWKRKRARRRRAKNDKR
ncbi:hypothetical protein FOZ63_027665 [Perkinsus olseni]|uniref:Uncharacterized protein n=2 Tax=Perkinsus olseni TaxID=32597 RepID=A0A7J6TVJ4_PEROL|nr:hypothetical protein FOZ63_027665 [Perkinsus olseni]